VLIWLAIVLGINVGHDLMYGPQAAYFSELFGTRVRYSGASVGYQLASILAGALAPLIAVALLDAWDSTLPVSLYLVAMCLISVVAVLAARETKGASLESEDTPAAAREERLVTR
jgi:MFS family permease